jgi:uncharacterized protein YggE
MKAKDLLMPGLLIVVICLLVARGPAAAAPVVAAAAPEIEPTGSITVSGSSAIRVEPDRVVVVFGIETFARSTRASQSQNDRLSRAVLAAIRDAGVPERYIATSEFTIQPRYDDYDRHVISGYAARNTVAVTLRNVDELENILVVALDAGATTVDGIEFSTTTLRELRDRARDMAIKAALEKAEAMASSAGVALGHVTNIHEDAWHYGYFGWWGGNRQWTNVQNVVQEIASEGGLMLEDGSLSLGQIVVRAQVGLTAQIMPDQ